eukprot:TRINITY_DN1958_c0_g1_i1.p1 TRINITY_DN1958_c0_g1~~TRINITY_DN1958_c0_g1_i1.p1  ORF type:complete len:290 (-),score=34.13 TRINITY_DN1958_c0_g1_i1:87-956(-)
MCENLKFVPRLGHFVLYTLLLGYYLLFEKGTEISIHKSPLLNFTEPTFGLSIQTNAIVALNQIVCESLGQSNINTCGNDVSWSEGGYTNYECKYASGYSQVFVDGELNITAPEDPNPPTPAILVVLCEPWSYNNGQQNYFWTNLQFKTEEDTGGVPLTCEAFGPAVFALPLNIDKFNDLVSYQSSVNFYSVSNMAMGSKYCEHYQRGFSMNDVQISELRMNFQSATVTEVKSVGARNSELVYLGTLLVLCVSEFALSGFLYCKSKRKRDRRRKYKHLAENVQQHEVITE